MTNKLVSIILPTYNGQDHVADSIESCLRQTYSNIELIIVNDCSKDNTLEISRSYAEKDTRVRVVDNPHNLKLPASLNAGFAEAKGDFLTWTADDNMYRDNAIAAIAHLAHAAELNRQRYGADSQVYATVLGNLAGAEAAAGEFAAAQQHIDTARGALPAKSGRANLLSIRAARVAGVLAFERDDRDTARRDFTDCVEGAAEARLDRYPGVSRCHVGLAELALQAGELDAAGAALDHAEAIQAGLDAPHFERGLAGLVRARWLLARG